MSRAVRVAAYIWAGSMLLSRVVGLVREAVIGRTLGGGAEADVYWAAFVLPEFLNYALASGALSIVFIPIFQARLQQSEDAAWGAFSTIATFMTGFAVLLTAALWVGAPQLVGWVAPGFDAAQLGELTRLTRIVLPAQIFFVVGGVISATLQARDRHAYPALAPVIYTMGIIVGGVGLAPSMGAEGFAWGVLFGALCGPFGLPLLDALRQGLRWRPWFSWRDADFRTYLWRTVPVMLGLSIVVVDDWLLKYFGSQSGEGAVSRLQYARTLMKVPLGVFGFALGLAAYPTLSRLFAAQRREEARQTLVGALRALAVLVAISTVGLAVAGADIAEVIWGTRRFAPEELTDIGALTGVFAAGLWAWSAQTLLARGFYAQGITWIPTVIGTAVMVVCLPLYWWLSRYGAVGLAAATSTAISLYAVALGVVLWRGFPKGPGVGDVVLRLVPAAAAAYTVGFELRAGLIEWPALLRGGVAGGVACAVCVALAWLLGVGEVTALWRRRRARL